jgi:hypothetical protein
MIFGFWLNTHCSKLPLLHSGKPEKALYSKEYDSHGAVIRAVDKNMAAP